MGCVRVVSSLLMVARLMVPGSLAMVVSGVAVMFGSLAVMVNCLLGHGCFPFPNERIAITAPHDKHSTRGKFRPLLLAVTDGITERLLPLVISSGQRGSRTTGSPRQCRRDGNARAPGVV